MSLHSIKVHIVSSATDKIGRIRFDERTRMFLKGATIVYDHTDHYFHLLMNPTEEDIERSRQTILQERSARKEWESKKVKRY